MSTQKSSNIKKRNWAMVLYPESAPSDWKDILSKTGLQFAISPLHDKDVNPTGEIKKAHYHIILCYSGPTSFNVVKSLCDSLSQPHPQPLEQVKGYFRYLTHKDNPDKAQYDDSDIECCNGFNILDYADLTKTEIREIKLRLIDLIDELGLVEYSHFIRHLRVNGLLTEFDIASTNTYFFEKYLSSIRNS